MASIEVRPIPGILHPKGEHIIKIMYDDNEPPKNYIWGKGEDEYYYWDGKQWATYEFGSAQEKDICSCSAKKGCCCDYITEDDLNAKFEKFKKDLLAAVLKLTKTGADVDVESLTRVVNNINNRVTDLENAEVDLDGYAKEDWVENNYQPKGDYLTEHQSLDNYYTKTEIDNKAIDRNQLEELALDLDFVKMIDITLAEYNALPVKQQNVVYNITDAEAYHYDPSALDASVSALRNRVSGVETSVSTMTPIVARLNAIDHDAYLTSDDLSTVQDRLTSVETSVHNLESIDHSQFITSDDLADFEPTNPSSVVNLEGYATEEYVDSAISNVINSAPAALDTLNELATALGNDANFATTVTNALANKANISDIPTATSQLTNDSGFITQATTDGLYEPKFTDLTGTTNPEATAQTYTSDNKVYITEVIEPEQGGE